MSAPSYNDKPYLNTCLADMEGEVWKEVKGYEGIYSVSNLGRLRSEERLVGVRGGGVRQKQQTILKQQVKTSKGLNNKLQVQFRTDSFIMTVNVGVIVGKTFLGECKKGEVYFRKNGIFHDLRVENLEISTTYTTNEKIRRRVIKPENIAK